MVDPVTLGTIGLISTIAGGAVSAGGALLGAQSQAAMYRYQAGVAQQNAQIAKNNAGYALQSGEQQAAQSGMASRARLGGIVTGQAASGFDVNSGTNTKVQQGQQLIASTDQTIIRSNAAKRAYDFDVGATQAEEQAGAYGSAADNSLLAGTISAAGSIIGTAGSVSGKWLQGIQSGLFSSDPFGMNSPSTQYGGS